MWRSPFRKVLSATMPRLGKREPSVAELINGRYEDALELTAAWPAAMRRAYVAGMPAYAKHRTDGERVAALAAHRAHGELVHSLYEIASRYRACSEFGDGMERLAVDLLLRPPGNRQEVHDTFVNHLADVSGPEISTVLPAATSEGSFTETSPGVAMFQSPPAEGDHWGRVTAKIKAELRAAGG